MIYAMISIGLLGFIVWSYIFLMALPYCEIGVKNFAICWNSSTLISTFNSKNLINYTQSAGNKTFQFSSSETTCKKYFNFTSFYEKFNLNIDPKFLEWFIGFSEGDGALLLNKNQPRFVLTQKEGDILYLIQKTLGFGKISYYPNDFYRYIVSNKEDIVKLIYIFNGNLVLLHRINQLSLWIHIFNLKQYYSYPCIMIPILPSLNDGWLSGFIDAEGCFNVSIHNRKNTKTNSRVMLRFILDQKNSESLFKSIYNLFNYGFISLRFKTNNVFRFTINSFEGLVFVRQYLDNFPLKTKKLISYSLWLKILNMILNKEHLDIEGLNIIEKLSKTININNSLTKKIGSSNK